MCNQFSLCRSVEDRGGIRSRFVMLSLMLSFILVMAEGVAVPAPAVAQETGEVSTSQTTNGETTNGESRPSTEENVSERQSAIATLLQPVFSFFKAYNATANSVADSASNVANKAEKWAEVSLQSGKSALGDSDLTGAESAGPEGLDQVQSPSVKDGQAAAPAELLSRGRAIRAIRLLIVAFGLIAVIGLIRLLLHLNHVAHGNYAGRLQFLGWAGTVILLAASLGVALNEDLWDWEVPKSAEVIEANAEGP